MGYVPQYMISHLQDVLEESGLAARQLFTRRGGRQLTAAEVGDI
jgi:hypothetical protein